MSGRGGTIVMLGGSRLQVPAILAARELGFRVVCADWDPEAVGFAEADEASLTSTLDVDAVERLARDVRADYVITSTSDAPVRVAALVSERLSLPTGISYENAVCATQKDAMRRRLAEHGVPQPGFRICEDASAFGEALDHFGWDCIAKPADSAASRGVRLLTPADRTDDVDGLFASFRDFSRKGTVMVEERAIGCEVSVEGMTVAGETTILTITDKMTTEPPYFVELGHTEPSRLPVLGQEEIRDVARSVVSAIGIVDGPSHTEIMLTEDGPEVIEMAARLGGDFITSRLVPLSTGVDMVRESVSLALGCGCDIEPKTARGAAIRFITAAKPGRIAKIDVPDGLGSRPGVEEVSLYLGAGDAIDSPHSSNDRIGHVVCTGPTAQEAADRADDALAAISVEMEGGAS